MSITQMGHERWPSTGFAVLALFLVAFSVVGCSRAAPNGESLKVPYYLEFEQAASQAESSFVREILADHAISDAEYAEARSGYMACLEDAGLEPSESVDDYGRIMVDLPWMEPPPGKDPHEYIWAPGEKECKAEWIGDIESLYLVTRDNPDKQDLDELTAACLVQQGLAPEGFKGADYKELVTRMGTTVELDSEGNSKVLSEPVDPNPILPGGVPLDSVEAANCQVAPYQTMHRGGISPSAS